MKQDELCACLTHPEVEKKNAKNCQSFANFRVSYSTLLIARSSDKIYFHENFSNLNRNDVNFHMGLDFCPYLVITKYEKCHLKNWIELICLKAKIVCFWKWSINIVKLNFVWTLSLKQFDSLYLTYLFIQWKFMNISKLETISFAIFCVVV